MVEQKHFCDFFSFENRENLFKNKSVFFSVRSPFISRSSYINNYIARSIQGKIHLRTASNEEKKWTSIREKNMKCALLVAARTWERQQKNVVCTVQDS